MTATMKTRTLAPWFGSDRMVVDSIGAELAGCEWVGIPFGGGMSAAAVINARTIAINDLHRHVINQAKVAADRILGPQLFRRVRRLPLHPEILADAQKRCRERDVQGNPGGLFGRPASAADVPDLEWAVDYFVCVWMGRSGKAGTPGEFKGGIAMRWEAGGGDSATRYQSATSSLLAMRQIFARATFTVGDAFDFLAAAKDADGHGLYVDAPWPEAGDGYTHAFSTEDQRRLAAVLRRFQKTRVVIRFGVHPLIQQLYPEPWWHWVLADGRDQANQVKPEALIINGPSYRKLAA